MNVLHSISTVCVVLATTLLPLSVRAQGGDKDTVQGYLILITNFIGDTLLPFLFALALLFFLVNVARYFIAGGNDAESQETAKKLAIYGVGAFVFLVSIWGIVNMFVSAFEIDDDQAKCPDYLEDWCGSTNSYGSSRGNYQRFDSYYEDISNDPNTTIVEQFEDGSQIQTVPVYDRDGNLVDQAEISVTELPPVATQAEPEEEADVHEENATTPTDEESAPVNIEDSVPAQERGTCIIDASGIENCSI